MMRLLTWIAWLLFFCIFCMGYASGDLTSQMFAFSGELLMIGYWIGAWLHDRRAER